MRLGPEVVSVYSSGGTGSQSPLVVAQGSLLGGVPESPSQGKQLLWPEPHPFPPSRAADVRLLEGGRIRIAGGGGL